MCGTAGEVTLPLSLSGAFPSPADYAALLHHDPAHTSQQVQLTLLPVSDCPRYLSRPAGPARESPWTCCGHCG